VVAGDRNLWIQLGRRTGLVLGAAGLIWLLSSVFLEEPLFRVVALVLLFGGLWVGVFDPGRFPTRRPRLVRVVVTTVFTSLALWQSVPPKPETEMPWEPYSVAALERAAARGQPVMIDFYADWCGPCHDLDRRVFGREEVVRAAGRFVKLRADLTDQDSRESALILERHGIIAFPTVVFIGSDGKEQTSLRLLGLETSVRFLARLRAVR